MHLLLESTNRRDDGCQTGWPLIISGLLALLCQSLGCSGEGIISALQCEHLISLPHPDREAPLG